MKIDYLAESSIPSRAANPIQIMKMCQAFAGNGCDTRLLVAGDGAAAQEGVFVYYGVCPTFSFRRLIYPALRGRSSMAAVHAAVLSRRRKPNLIYTRSLVLGERVSRLTRIPVIFEAHVPVSAPLRARFASLIRMPSFCHLVVISQALYKYFLTQHPELDGRVVVAHDAADAPPSDLEPMRLRRGDRLVAGYCGQLFKGKGAEVIVELARLRPEVDFHIVGGEAEDIAHWRNVAGDLPNLIFHGFKPPSEAQRYVAGFDMALAPYQRRVEVYSGGVDIAPWMSPLKLFEYMAFGKPIVSSDLPVLREVLADGRNALLCSPEDLDAWRKAIGKLADPNLRQRLSHQARTDFEAGYTWTQRARAVIADLPAGG